MASEAEREAQIFGPPTIQLIQASAWALITSRRVIYAAFTVMLWDLILTLPKEVSLIWSSRLTVVKILFLFNRYASPLVMAVNVWMMSGLAVGLSSNICRGWFTTAFTIQLICTTFVSILISFRLWAWYGMSSRSLWVLSMVWVASFAAAFALIIYLVWGKLNLIHDPWFNICTSLAPVIWVQWLPGTLEHAFYFIFLLVGAMSTPRSAQTPALAVLYRDGILFYLVTFMIMLAALLVWAITPRIWLGLVLYMPWIVFQMAISHLLLEVRTSELFQRRKEESSSTGMIRTASPLRDFAMSRPMDSKHQQQREKHVHSPLSYNMSDVSRPSFHALEQDDDRHSSRHSEHGSDRGSSVHVYRKPNKRFWWMIGRSHTDSRDIHVDVLADDYTDDGRGGAVGGVKDSRLGRFDSWLW